MIMTTAIEIRKWAVRNGFPELEGKRGRLPIKAIEAFNGFNNGNNGLYEVPGTMTPGQAAEINPVKSHAQPIQHPCRSAITLPVGLTAPMVLDNYNKLCSGCDENPATEVVSLVDGTRPNEITGYTVLCGYCLCEWRGR